ncbi:MAG: FAD-dependent oxidoreductase [Anaerolineae bacterium]|nr:FAD-dependent oxidoreductase [Anaerolineae bacterium]
MKTRTRRKVLIVGGGPTGLATALHLAQRAPALAAETLILEAKQHPRPKLCGGGVTVHGDEQLAALGVAIDAPSFCGTPPGFSVGRARLHDPAPERHARF